MAVKKRKGMPSHNGKRYINGVEVKPTKYYSASTSGVMAGTVDGELVRDSKGAVVPLHNIEAEWK